MSNWELPPSDLALSNDAVHVWRAGVQLPTTRLDALAAVLSDDERQRAQRFKFAQHRDHFIAARGILRSVLGRYLKTPPETLHFVYGEYGKPALQGAEHLHFNLSHSRDQALYAIAHNRRLGIDIEYARRAVNDAALAERFFAKMEVAALKEVPQARRPEAFFNCWTRKEAYLKARGEGITVSLDSFAVSLKPDVPAALLHCDRFPAEICRWALHSFTPQPDYIAALCTEGKPTVHYWQWPDSG